MLDDHLVRRRALLATATVRRFRRMLGVVIGLFLTTEILARTGAVPHLQPLSLHQIATDILFGIGFGCPIVLYVSSVPRWREAALVAALGVALTLAISAPLDQLGIAQLIIGLGLGCLIVLAIRAARSRGRDRTTALLFLLPSAVALIYTLQAGVFLNYLAYAVPQTFDSLAYVVDSGYGFQPAFAAGRLFEAVPALKWICYAIYAAPPPILIYVYALQVRASRPPPVDGITVLLVLGLTGYAFYFLYPVCGPVFAFGDLFPDSRPAVEPLAGMPMTVAPVHATHLAWRNAMPSLHFGSVLLAFWHARPFGPWARHVAAIFVGGTILATLGLGEHYLVDLVVACPFTLAVQAACTNPPEQAGQTRRQVLAGSLALVAIWYLILFKGTSLLAGSIPLTWSLTAATVLTVVVLERRLYRAAFPDAAGVTSPAARRDVVDSSSGAAGVS